MSKRATTTLGVGLLVLVAGVLVLFGSRSREPAYQGRTLTSWLEQRDDASPVDIQRIAEAQAAVRAIGATQALPFLLEMAATRDSPLRRWLIQAVEGRQPHLFIIPEARRIQRLGLAGFEILGTNGAPAVPELARLMADPDEAAIALECLARVGKPAEVPVCQALTNSDPAIRSLSTSLLARVTDHPDTLLARLTKCLDDPAPRVRRAAVEGIGRQTQAPDAAIRLLVFALKDKDEDVASVAAKVLGNFGTNALRAFSALTNAVASGSDATANRALKTLVTLAPDEALPIVLRGVRSPLARRKSYAVAMLGEYKTASPEIVAALSAASADPDPRVAFRARNSSLRLREEIRKAGGDPVVIPNEPVWEGRQFGEWLNQHVKDGGFSEQAKAALRHMGTNAIPGLLARLAYTDPVFGLSDPDINIQGALALALLGEAAKPALPKLADLMDNNDQQIASFALIAAGEMGPNSVPVVIRALTNRHWEVRNEAVSQLLEQAGRPAPDSLRPAVPFLVKLLDDPNESLRVSATNALKKIAPEAAARAGVK